MDLKYIQPDNPFYRDKDIRDAYAEDDGSGLILIRFRSLDAVNGISAAFTTRYGGVSTGCRASLNLGPGRGDAPGNVRMNFDRVMARFGGRTADIALTEQVHETTLVRASWDLTLGESFTRHIRRTDGVYTDIPGIVLSATFADCVPVFLADRNGNRIALVHSGWRGTVGRIAAKGVEALLGMGARAEDIVAVTGPCISGGHYEVTEEVTEVFRSVFKEDECSAIIKRTDEIHSLIDLPAAIWHTLRAAGVKEENIHFSGLCTYENAEHLFSHRASRGRRGAMNAFMRIND